MRVETVFEPDDAGALRIPPLDATPGSYFNLRENPRAVERLEVARRHPPLRSFLTAVNSGDSLLATAACKTWHGAATDATAGESHEFAGRVDLAFAGEALNLQRSHYEELTRKIEELLAREPAEALRAQLLVLPCDFVALGSRGFCLRILLWARGATPEQAELRWGLGLARVQQALLFSSRVLRQQIVQAS